MRAVDGGAIGALALGIVVAGASAAAQPYVVDLAVTSQLNQCARMSDGTVRCRGLNAEGRLGNGRTNEVNVPPTTVPNLTDVEQVIVDVIGATCSRHRDGTVRCWGSNSEGLLGVGHTGDQDCRGRPCRMSPTLVPGLSEVVELANTNGAICAVRRDGSVWCWGQSRLIHAASPTPVATGLSDVAAMWPLAFGWIWRLRSGGYRYDTPYATLGIPPEAEIGGGETGYHRCYRLPDGSVRCVGANSHGQLGNGRSTPDEPAEMSGTADPGLRGVRSISTSTTNTCAVLRDRTVWCWGDGRRGALGSTPTEFCTGRHGSEPCATRPRRVPGLSGADRVFVGVWGGCALRVDHSVWCWGALAPGGNVAPASVAW